MRLLFFLLFILGNAVTALAQPERIDSLLNASWDSRQATFSRDTVFYMIAIPVNQKKPADERMLKDLDKLRSSLDKKQIVYDSLFRTNDSVFINTSISGDSLKKLWEEQERSKMNKWVKDKFSDRIKFNIYTIDGNGGTGIQRRQQADPFFSSMMVSPGPAISYEKENSELLKQIITEIHRCVPAYTAEQFEKLEREKKMLLPAQKNTFRKDVLENLKKFKC